MARNNPTFKLNSAFLKKEKSNESMIINITKIGVFTIKFKNLSMFYF